MMMLNAQQEKNKTGSFFTLNPLILRAYIIIRAYKIFNIFH